jgi:hypothetical protein
MTRAYAVAYQSNPLTGKMRDVSSLQKLRDVGKI